MASPYKPILDIIATNPPTTMLNIGIRHGGEWDYFHEQLPELKLVALEPIEEERNKFLKGHPEEEVHQLAVWSSGCSKTLFTGKLCPSFHLKGRGREVNCVTLDWVWKTLVELTPLILWIDIEGSELEAFKGATELLESGDAPFIYTELRSEAKKRSPSWCTDTEVIEYLRGFGYSVALKQQERDKDHYDVLFTQGAI
mgnify:CR=1 FL=1|jgi:FkbM family methyltransferase|tara:strand:- start:1776 stop:2369 length:594 start_codon:yes stop_codon:yes gene_type:complete